MSLITVPTTLEAYQLRQYLKKLDELGVVYHFTISAVDEHITLELMVDSSDVGVKVRLYPRGSWAAEGTLIVGEKTSI